MTPARQLAIAILSAALATLSCQTNAPSEEEGRAALERGIQAHNEGRSEDARRAYFQVLAHDPQNKFAFFNLGQLHRIQNDLSVAEGYYRQALKGDSDFGPALFGLGLTRLAAGAWQEALDLNLRVIQLQPENAAGHFNLGQAFRGLGREAEAQESFARAAQLDPRLQLPPTPTITPGAP